MERHFDHFYMYELWISISFTLIPTVKKRWRYHEKYWKSLNASRSLISFFSWKSALTMAGTIRLFVRVRKIYYVLGLDPSQMDTKWCLNGKNLIVLFLLIQMFISTMAFGLCEATTLFEYGSCAFICISELACCLAYLTKRFIIVELLNWIKRVDELIENSKRTK